MDSSRAYIHTPEKGSKPSTPAKPLARARFTKAQAVHKPSQAVHKPSTHSRELSPNHE